MGRAKKKMMIMILLRLVVYGLLIYGGIRFFEWKNVYHPTRELDADPLDYGVEYEDVTIVTEDDVQLHGWWIPHRDAEGTVIMFHGNGGNIGGRAWLAPDLHSLGVNVLMFDYRGYGRSEGIPTEKGTYRDARAVYEFVRTQYGDSPKAPVILYGRSLGGAIAAQCAVEKPVAGVVLESTFSSIKDMARDIYKSVPVHRLCTFKYDTASKIDRIDAPLLIAASKEDSMIPWEQGRKIFEAAKQPKKWIDINGDHNVAGWDNSEAYWREFKAFIEKAVGTVKNFMKTERQ